MRSASVGSLELCSKFKQRCSQAPRATRGPRQLLRAFCRRAIPRASFGHSSHSPRRFRWASKLTTHVDSGVSSGSRHRQLNALFVRQATPRQRERPLGSPHGSLGDLVDHVDRRDPASRRDRRSTLMRAGAVGSLAIQCRHANRTVGTSSICIPTPVAGSGRSSTKKA